MAHNNLNYLSTPILNGKFRNTKTVSEQLNIEMNSAYTFFKNTRWAKLILVWYAQNLQFIISFKIIGQYAINIKLLKVIAHNLPFLFLRKGLKLNDRQPDILKFKKAWYVLRIPKTFKEGKNWSIDRGS